MSERKVIREMQLSHQQVSSPRNDGEAGIPSAKTIPPEIIEDIIIHVLFSDDSAHRRRKTFKSLTLLCKTWSAEARRLELLHLEVRSYSELDALTAYLRFRCDQRTRLPTRKLVLDLCNDIDIRDGNLAGSPTHEEIAWLLEYLDLQALEEFSLASDWETLYFPQGELHGTIVPPTTDAYVFPRVRSLNFDGINSLFMFDILTSCNPTYLTNLSYTGEMYLEEPLAETISFPNLKVLTRQNLNRNDFRIFYAGLDSRPPIAPNLEVVIAKDMYKPDWRAIRRTLKARTLARVKTVKFFFSDTTLECGKSDLSEAKELAVAMGFKVVVKMQGLTYVFPCAQTAPARDSSQ